MFEFDPVKSAANLAKHGIDFEQAQARWDDGKAIRLPSEVPVDEERWLVFGRIEGEILDRNRHPSRRCGADHLGTPGARL